VTGFRSPGPLCATTQPASDSGTTCLGRTLAPCSVGLGANGHELYKRLSHHPHTQRVPGMSPAEGDRALLKAVDDAAKLLGQRQRDLTQWNRDTEENFLAWFGTTEEKARAIISKRIAKAIAKLGRLTLLDFVAIRAPRKKGVTARQYQRALEDYNSTFAFVNPGTRYKGRYELTVHIGPEFASADDVTRAGTLVHEVSHFLSVGDTDDVSETFVGDPRPKNRREMYGYTKTARLSMKNPQEALKNADNFEFFIEKHDPADHDLDLDGAGDFPGQASAPSRG
jgi:hypothetical protein